MKNIYYRDLIKYYYVYMLNVLYNIHNMSDY